MAAFHFSFRAAASWLLVSVLSGVFPAAGADALPPAPPDIVRAAPQPGVSALQDPAPQQDPPQSVTQRPPEQTPATAAPPKRHRSPWLWVAIVAGVAAGAGAAIIVAGHQPGRTSAPIPSVTVNVGGGSAGAPH